MKNINKNMKMWLILTPYLVVAFMFISAYLSMMWYQDTMYKKLKDSSQDTNLIVVYNQLDRQMNNLEREDAVIFHKKDTTITDKKLISYFRVSLNKTNDFTFLFKMDKDRKRLKVLYSSSPTIKVGSYIPKDRYIVLDKDTIAELLETNEYYATSVYDKTNTLYKLFKYYPKSDLVVSVGTIREKYDISFDRNTKSVTKTTNETRSIVMLIEFLMSLVGAIIVSLVIKRGISDYDDIQAQLVKSNESLKLSNKALEEQLLLDPMTRLPNKRSMMQSIRKMIMPKLILVEIDDFRKMSEYYSQETIEKIIIYVKNVLNKHVQKHNEYEMRLYHVDSSQFALLEEAPLDTGRYEELADKLSSSLKGIRVKCHGKDKCYAEFNCTIGFSLEDANTYETAVTALRRAMEKEKDYICYFKILGEDEEFKKQVQGAEFIKNALDNDKVVPFFQPIYDKDKNIIKHECLVRIIDEGGNIVSPYLFLDTSKKIKRYTQIEMALIRKSLDAISDTNKTVSINLSSRDMIDPEVKNFVIDEITRRNIAKQVVFEILEDESIDSIDRVIDFIKRVKSMGIRIAIDDFGSGYSNYSYMLDLRPDYVKIDGSLIKNIDHDHISHAIVSSIIVFTKRLGIKTIAEFVHSKEVFEVCKDLGIDEFQGFYLSEPRESLL